MDSYWICEYACIVSWVIDVLEVYSTTKKARDIFNKEELNHLKILS